MGSAKKSAAGKSRAKYVHRHTALLDEREDRLVKDILEAQGWPFTELIRHFINRHGGTLLGPNSHDPSDTLLEDVLEDKDLASLVKLTARKLGVSPWNLIRETVAEGIEKKVDQARARQSRMGEMRKTLGGDDA